MNFTEKIFSLRQVNTLSREILRTFPAMRIFLLKGGLGAGKTTLVSGFMHALGQKIAVSSPTYALIHEYPGTRQSVFHMDLYRMKSQEELAALGIRDYLDSGSYVFIEWPERLEPYLERPYLELTLSLRESAKRQVVIQPFL